MEYYTTDRELDIKIAKFHGWKYHEDWEGLTSSFNGSRGRGEAWERPDGKISFEFKPPYYCSDLNAMHEAEQLLVGRNCQWEGYTSVEKYISILEGIMRSRLTTFATARQRAEAFVKAMEDK